MPFRLPSRMNVLYNPLLQTPDDLIAGFFVRQRLFDALFRDISQAASQKVVPHYLLQGAWGMGKTSLLLRLAYEVEYTPALRKHAIPLVFREAEYGIGSLAEVWERTAQYLAEADARFQGLYETMVPHYHQANYEERAFDLLTASLREHEQRLLLLVDNVGAILKKLDSSEKKRLEEILRTSSDWQLIGTTALRTSQLPTQTAPLFANCQLITLDALTYQEVNDLFLGLNGTNDFQRFIGRQAGRIEAVRRLMDGTVRTMVQLFDVLNRQPEGSVLSDFDVLMDWLTPVYQHRMDDLPAQQQKIVAALAQFWDAAGTKELSQTVRLESKVVSAQLMQLISSGMVEKVETNTKNHLYRLAERPFNLWYLLRFGQKTDRRLNWFVQFLEGITGGYLTRTDGPETEPASVAAPPDEAMDTTRSDLIPADRELLQMLSQSETEREEYEVWVSFLLYGKGAEKEDYEAYLALLDQLTEYSGVLYHHKGISLWQLGQYAEAEAQFTKGMESGYGPATQALGRLYNQQYANPDAAWTYLAKAVEQGDLAAASAAFALAQQQNEPQQAIRYSHLVTLVEVFTNKLQRHSYLENRRLMTMLFFQLLFKKDLAQLKYVIETIDESFEEDDSVLLLDNIVNLWLNNFENIKPHNFDFLTDNINDWSSYLVGLFLKLCLAKKQYNTAYYYFRQDEWQLRDRFKPIYYATIHYLRSDYPIDYLRMGRDLKETVDDVLAEVSQMAKEYA